MSTGQTMITAAFFVLLTVAVMSANRMIIESNKDYLEEEAIEQATNFASALLSEILTKKFDSQVKTDEYQNPWDFDWAMGPSSTARNRINPWPDRAPYKSIPGPDGNYYDDVDDYNGYERTANSSSISGFHLKVSVYYVSKSNPNAAAGTQTYFKRIDVTVDHPIYMLKKATFSAIATY